MKRTVLLFAAVAFISCGEKKPEGPAEALNDAVVSEPVDKTGIVADTLTPEETSTDVTVTVKGTVAHIVPGKDGYMAEIRDDGDRVYFATISRTGLKNQGQYREAKIGDVITVKGESWKMDEELHIKVEDIK